MVCKQRTHGGTKNRHTALTVWTVPNISGGRATPIEMPIKYESSTARIQRSITTAAAVSGALNKTLTLQTTQQPYRVSEDLAEAGISHNSTGLFQQEAHRLNIYTTVKATYRYDAVSEENSAEIVKRANGTKHTPVRYGSLSTRTRIHVGTRKPRKR